MSPVPPWIVRATSRFVPPSGSMRFPAASSRTNRTQCAENVYCRSTASSFSCRIPPAFPLDGAELDAIYELPYMRTWHPCYADQGGVPAIQEVEFSITHNRGCFGGCNFCAIAFHQGRMVTTRSEESVLREAKLLTRLPNFKGYIHDVGGLRRISVLPPVRNRKQWDSAPGKNALHRSPVRLCRWITAAISISCARCVCPGCEARVHSFRNSL